MKIIVGLGNPGKEYENTRHNVGFLALDQIIKKTIKQESKKTNNQENNKTKKQEYSIPASPAGRFNIQYSQPFKFEKRFNAEIAKLKLGDQDVLLVKPQTFMNLSGEAVKKIVDFYKADPKADLIVIHDDIDIPLGKLKIAIQGSSAGHKGIQSLIDMLGTDGFTRIRIGIGRPENELIKVEDWVLQKMPDVEKEVLFGLIEDLIVQGAQYLGM